MEIIFQIYNNTVGICKITAYEFPLFIYIFITYILMIVFMYVIGH